MLLGLGRGWDPIFGHMTSPKCQLDEFPKVLFQGLEWHFKRIFCLSSSPKCYVIEVEKGVFQVVACQC